MINVKLSELSQEKFSEVERILKEYGISIKTDDGDFKTLFQVIEELSDVYIRMDFEDRMENMAEL